MKDTLPKANAALLSVFVACGLGLSMATLRKAVADSSGGSSSGCPLQYGSSNCPDTHIIFTEPVLLSGTACSTVNTYDCCLYDRYRQDCTPKDYNGQQTYTFFSKLIGTNHFKDCQQGRCVAFPGSSSGGSSSGGSSYASRSSYYFQV